MTPYKVRESIFKGWDNVKRNYIYENVINEYYTQEQITEMVNFIKQVTVPPSEIEEGAHFAFYKFTIFPRNEFTNKFPDFKLKKKDWKYYVIEEHHIVDSGYCNDVQETDEKGIYKFGVDYYDRNNKIIRIKRTPNSHLINIYKKLKENADAKIVLLEELNEIAKNNDLELNDKLFKTIDKLLMSNEQDVFIGMQMLTGLNYEKYCDEISFLIHKNYSRVVKGRKNVKIKHFLKVVENDYEYISVSSLNYLISMIEKNIPDKLAAEITTYCLKTFNKSEKKLILKYYE